MWERDKREEQIEESRKERKAREIQIDQHQDIIERDRAERQRGVHPGPYTERFPGAERTPLKDATDDLTESFQKLNKTVQEQEQKRTVPASGAAITEEAILRRLIDMKAPLTEASIAEMRKRMMEEATQTPTLPAAERGRQESYRQRDYARRTRPEPADPMEAFRARSLPSESIDPNRIRDIIKSFEDADRRKIRGQARRRATRRAARRRRHMAYYHARLARSRRGIRGIITGGGGAYRGGYATMLRSMRAGNMFAFGRLAMGLAQSVLGSWAPTLVAGWTMPAIGNAISSGITEHNRGGARVNAQVAAAFNSYDVGNFLRSIEFTERTKTSTLDLIAAQGASNQALMPLNVAMRNTLNTFGTWTARSSASMAMGLEPYYNVWNQIVTSDAARTFVSRGSAAIGAFGSGFMEGATAAGLAAAPLGPWASSVAAFVGGTALGVYDAVRELLTGDKARALNELEAQERKFQEEYGTRQADFLRISGAPLKGEKFSPNPVHFAR